MTVFFFHSSQVSQFNSFHLSTLLVGRNFRLAFNHQTPDCIGKTTGDARRHYRNGSFFVGDGIQNASSQTSDTTYSIIINTKMRGMKDDKKNT